MALPTMGNPARPARTSAGRCVFNTLGRPNARERWSETGIGTTAGTTVVFSSRMKLTLARLVAIVVLSLHVMPLGLPLLCDTDRRCDDQMPMSMPSGPTIDQTSSATDCATSVFCAAMGTAALILSTPVSVAVSDSYVVSFDVSTFARFDPQTPPAPPPQA